MSISLFLLLLLHPLLFSSNVFSQQVHDSDDGHARFEMIHRHSPQLAQYNLSNVRPPGSKREQMEQLIQSDNARQQVIAHRVEQRKRGQDSEGRRAAEIFPGIHIANSQIEIPLRSAADTGIGQYFVSFRVGSPPQKFVLIADTGSDLTWMNCDYVKCRECPKRNGSHHGRIFQADKSSSFKTISCLSETCKVDLQQSFSLSRCPTPVTPCAYDYRYFDGSRVQGFFATETVKVGLDINRKIKLHDVIVGCSHSSEGPSFKEADGVMGLGYDNNSFALKAAKLFGNKFSYCLVDHLSPSNLVNSLNFGNATRSNNKNMQYTNLILGVVNPYYAVAVSGISVAGKMLNISSEIWNIHGSGGAILDSGSTLTFLVEPAYKAVIAALETAILSVQKCQKLQRVVGPLKTCFSDKGFEMARVPELVWHFAGGAKLAAPVKSYVVDADEGVKCLAFSPAEWPGTTVIGNIMQQNHLWEFDLARSKVGFAPSSCLEFQPKV